MNIAVKPPVHFDTSALVKRTRWHLSPERMVLTVGTDTMQLAQGMASNAAVTAPAAVPPIGDAAQALAHLEFADPRYLLMSLVHLTGDETLLDRFAPFIPAQIAGGAKGVAGIVLPDAMRQELRERLVAILTQHPKPLEHPISPRLFQKMMSVCAGEPIGDEFVPLILEQAGFTGTQGVDLSARARPGERRKIVIIGAGLSGIALGAKLGELGYDYEIIEKNPELGGTWWINRYPGVGVDTPSHYYSYSFNINTEWPKYFPQGATVAAYLKQSAQRFGVHDRIEFETELLTAAFDEAAGNWKLRTRDKSGAERERTADIFIPAINFTCAVHKPAIKGLERFRGPVLHTAEWDTELNLQGKRIAVIGTGASSMQLCTAVAPEAAQLTIFQRSRHWVVPAPLVGVAVPEGVIWAQRHIPHYAQWMRFNTYWTSSDGIYPVVVMDPDWTMKDVSVSAANERRRQLMLAYIENELAGRPDLIAKVIPDYPPMGKRILLDHGWYKMLRRDNVELNDTGIAEITEDAIITGDGKTIPADAIVLSTGFTMRPMLPNLTITGRGGLSLNEAWSDDNPRAYFGMLVPGFPNLLVFNGPNSLPTHGAGQNLVSEASANFALGLLDLLASANAQTLECKAEAHDEYNARLDEALAQMVWNHPKAQSYYLNKHRRNTMSNPWRLVDFWWATRRPDPADFILISK